jgi:hypothetical protein
MELIAAPSSIAFFLSMQQVFTQKYLGRFYVRAGQPLHPNKMIVFRTTPPIYYTTYETKTSENDYDL